MRIAFQVVLTLLLGVVECVGGEWTQSQEGAWLWNPFPQPNEVISWTGKIDGQGYATGSGLDIWRMNSKLIEINAGSMLNGVHDGLNYGIQRDGDVHVALYRNGERVPTRNRLEVNGSFSPWKDSAGAYWISSQEGAKIWSSSPEPRESCIWNGATNSDGYANGAGVVIWYSNDRVSRVDAGSFANGRPNGLMGQALVDGRKRIVYCANGETIPLKVRYDIIERSAPPARQPVPQEPRSQPSRTGGSELTSGEAFAGLALAGLLLFADSRARERDSIDQAIEANRESISNNGYTPGAFVQSRQHGGHSLISVEGWDGRIVEQLNNSAYRVKIEQARFDGPYLQGHTYDFFESDIRPFQK